MGPVGVRSAVPLLEFERARGNHVGRLFLAPPELPFLSEDTAPNAKKPLNTGLGPGGDVRALSALGVGGQGWERTQVLPDSV